jgi:Na+-driven multidrug efflux pump
MNALGSLIRGTGNMLVPALSGLHRGGALIPLSPLLIFGWGRCPLRHRRRRLRGALTSALTTAVLAWYLLSGRAIVRLRLARLQWPMFADILRVGGVGTISTLQTSLTVALTTAIVGAVRRPEPQVAGYGTGARLEYLLIPLGVRLRRAAGRAGRHQHRRRPARAGAASSP